MTENELKLWERCRQEEESAREELIWFYLPFVDVLARKISRATNWADWRDLRQSGVIGLMKAIDRFNPSQGVEFKHFARSYICGAIYDSPELTRDLARQQEAIHRKIKPVEIELTKKLRRNPTIGEIAEKTGFTVEQIRNAIDAMGIAFAGALPDAEDPPLEGKLDSEPEEFMIVRSFLSRLPQREMEIIGDYYWRGLLDREIAEKLQIKENNVRQIRHRVILKLRSLFEVDKKNK